MILEDYNNYLNIVYPNEVFENCRIQYSRWPIAESAYLFVAEYVKTFFISNYIEEEKNDITDEKIFHKFLQISNENIKDISGRCLLKRMQYIANGEVVSDVEKQVYNKLETNIVENIDYYKQYDLMNELNWLSYYILLNKNEEIFGFIKEQRIIKGIIDIVYVLSRIVIVINIVSILEKSYIITNIIILCIMCMVAYITEKIKEGYIYNKY